MNCQFLGSWGHSEDSNSVFLFTIQLRSNYLQYSLEGEADFITVITCCARGQERVIAVRAPKCVLGDLTTWTEDKGSRKDGKQLPPVAMGFGRWQKWDYEVPSGGTNPNLLCPSSQIKESWVFANKQLPLSWCKGNASTTGERKRLKLSDETEDGFIVWRNEKLQTHLNHHLITFFIRNFLPRSASILRTQ